MILVELALQGVSGFPGQLRLPFKGGVNVACDVDPQRREAIIDAVYHCLYPDTSRAEATAHLADPDAAESRIALTFHGRDRVTYRLIRDVVSGAMKLYRFDPEAKKYRLFTASAAEAAQYVRVQQQLPDEVSFERLFVYGPKSLPSQGDRARTRSGAGLMSAPVEPSGPGLPPARFLSSAMGRPGSTLGRMPPGALDSANAAGPGFNPNNALVLSEMQQANTPDVAPQEEVLPETIAEKKSLLLRLRADLDAVIRAQRAQQEIDQLAARQFEISERLQGLSKLDGSLQALIAERDADQGLESMPPSLGERLRSYETREERFRADEQKIQDEMIRVGREAEEDLVLPLQQDRYFLISLGLAVLFVALAIVLSKPLIAALNIPAALVAVAAAFRYIADLERSKQREGRVQSIEDRMERLLKQRDLDTGVTRLMMEKLDIDSPSTLLARVETYEAREAEIQRVQTALQTHRSDPASQQEAQELQQVEQRIGVLEEEVVAASGAMHSEETLRRRVAHLERELGPDVPPRIKSPPLGLSGSGRVRVQTPQGSPAVDLSGDLVAQSPFSSHVAAASPLQNTGEWNAVSTSELAVSPPPRAQSRGSSGVFPAPARAQTGDLGASTGEFLFQGSSGVFAAPPRGGSGVQAVRRTGDLRPITSDLPVVRGTGEAQPTGRNPSVVGGSPAPRGPTAPPRTGSTAQLPSFPSADSGAVHPSAPGLPAAQSGPVVPATPPSAEQGMFDYGGGYIGDDEEDDEAPKKQGDDDADPDGSARTAGYLAMGSGMSGFGGGGGIGGYSDGGAASADRSRELVQAAVDQLSVSVDDLGTRLVPRLGQYLEAFTAKAIKKAKLGPRGEVTVLPEEGEPIAYPDLGPDLLDTVDLALRFALAECVLRKFRIPVFVDDPLWAQDDKRRRLFGQMLGYFGRASQVVVMSGQSDLQGSRLDIGPSA